MLERPYVQAWLKRVERQLRGSGRLSQIALSLSRQCGGDADEWSRHLRDILDGRQAPSAELIADIDQILAKPGDSADKPSEQGNLF